MTSNYKTKRKVLLPLLVAILGCACAVPKYPDEPAVDEALAQHNREEHARLQEIAAREEKEAEMRFTEEKRQHFEKYLALAPKGDPEAQSRLGAAYYNGYGVSKDEVKGLYWITKAADKGNADAQSHLGEIFSYTNPDLARPWFIKAASQGQPTARRKVHQMLALEINAEFMATVLFPRHMDYIGGKLPPLGRASYKRNPIYIALDTGWAFTPMTQRRDLAMKILQMVQGYPMLGIDAITIHVAAGKWETREIMYLETPWKKILFGDSMASTRLDFDHPGQVLPLDD